MHKLGMNSKTNGNTINQYKLDAIYCTVVVHRQTSESAFTVCTSFYG